jgi:hypothetical protein
LELVHVIARPVSTLLDASRSTALACVVPPTMTEGAVSDTVTLATGPGTDETVSTTPSLCPSLVAVIVVLPTVSVVTSPLLFTVATAGLELLHLITRPVSTLPEASEVTAVACAVPPTVTDAGDSDTVTLVTGTGAAATSSTALPLRPSLVAVIETAPTLTAVTAPLLFTVATAVLELLHTMARPVSTLLEASRTTTAACVTPPTVTDGADSETLTVATGAGETETDADPTTASTVALILVLPGETARTRPVDDTTATVLFADRHSTARSVNTAPVLSRTVAVRSLVSPVTIDTMSGDTSTRVTAGDRTSTVALARRPSAAAKTRPVPTPTPTTVPSDATLNTLGAPEVQTTGR